MPASVIEDFRTVKKNVRKYLFTIASDSGSDVTPEKVFGTVHKVKIKPDSGGTQPTNGFNIDIADEDGDSIIGTQGNASSNVNTKVFNPMLTGSDSAGNSTLCPISLATVLTVSWSGVGVGKGVRVTIWIG